MPIKHVEERRPAKERQIEVKILSRRPANSTKKTPIPIRFGSKFGNANIKRVIKNGTVIDLGSPSAEASASQASSASAIPNQAKIIYLNSAKKSEDESSQEETVSAIKSFLEETSPEKSTTTIIDGKEVRVPAGIKITSAGKGVVNIRAITDSRPSPSNVKSTGRSPLTVTPSKPTAPLTTAVTAGNSATAKKSVNVGSVRGMKGVSMVTLTAGGIIKKVSDPKKSSRSDEDDHDDEGDSDDMFDDEDDDDDDDMMQEKSFKATPQPAKKRVGRPPKNASFADDDDYKPPSGVALKTKPKKIPILKQSTTEDVASPTTSAAATVAEPEEVVSKDDVVVAADVDAANSTFDDSTASGSGEEPRSKRARKEKKIFDL